MRDEAGRGIFVFGERSIGYCAENELMVGGKEGIGVSFGVVLGFVVTPPMITNFLFKYLVDWGGGIKLSDPVGCGS